MDEIKNKIKAMTSQNALALYCGIAGLLFIFMLILPQYCVSVKMFGISQSQGFNIGDIGDVFEANAFAGLLYVINLLLPLGAIALACFTRNIDVRMAVIVVGVAFVSGIIMYALKVSAFGASFGSFGISFGWILNLLIGAAWCAFAKFRQA